MLRVPIVPSEVREGRDGPRRPRVPHRVVGGSRAGSGRWPLLPSARGESPGNPAGLSCLPGPSWCYLWCRPPREGNREAGARGGCGGPGQPGEGRLQGYLLCSWYLSCSCSAQPGNRAAVRRQQHPPPSLPEQSKAKPPWRSRSVDLHLGHHGRSRSSDAPSRITSPRFPHSSPRSSGSLQLHSQRKPLLQSGRAGAGQGWAGPGQGAERGGCRGRGAANASPGASRRRERSVRSLKRGDHVNLKISYED